MQRPCSRLALFLVTLQEGSWFGEIALLKDIVRTASVRSVTVCWLFQLDKRVFNKVHVTLPCVFAFDPLCRCDHVSMHAPACAAFQP